MYKSPFNLVNLRLLADGLKTIQPERYNQRSWCTGAEIEDETIPTNTCGTSACTLGWAPALVTPREIDKFGNAEHWFNYGFRIFVLDTSRLNAWAAWDILYPALFSGHLSNSLPDAIGRIETFIASELQKENTK